MEAIGLAASILQLITTATQIVQYVNEIKNAPKEATQFAQEASNLVSLLWSLRNRVKEAQGQRTSWLTNVASLGVPNGLIDQLQEALQRMAETLEKARKPSKRLLWPLDKKELNLILSRIERLKTSVGLALQDDLIKLTRIIESYTAELPLHGRALTRVKSLLEEQEIRAINEQHRQVIEWLSPLNFFAIQNETLQKREKGTATWLLDDTTYNKWINSTGDILCCQGIPGAGKTVLASVVVDHLQRICQCSTDSAIACIYFRYSERASQTPANLVASLWRQLVDSHEPMSRELNELYAKSLIQGTRPTLDEVVGLLQLEFASRDKVYIILDALDECPVEKNTRSSILDIIRTLEPKPNVLVTSRMFDQDLLTTGHVTLLEIGARTEDMQKYITARIQREDRLRKNVSRDDTLAEVIVQTLVKRANKMFLLVTLHIDALVTKLNPKAVRKALESLPEELNDTYQNVLERINSQNTDDCDIAHSVLSWLCYTKRSLTMRELQEALSIDWDEPELDPHSMTDQDLLIAVCAGLVVADAESQIVRFVHSTTQEYFESIREIQYPKAEYNIIVTCIRYLCLDEFSGSYSKWQEASGPAEQREFIRYAAVFWGEHLRGPLETPLYDRALELLDDQPKLCFASQILLLEVCGHMVNENVITSTQGQIWTDGPKNLALSVAAYFGLDYVVKQLLRNYSILPSHRKIHAHVDNAEWMLYDPKDLIYGTALHWAALGSHESTLDLLLSEEDIKRLINQRNENLNTALFEAVRTRRRQSMRQLIQHGADLFLNGDHNTVTVLHTAACYGTVDDIEVLMGSSEKQKLLLYRAVGGSTALHGAASFNRSDTTKALLDHGAPLYELEKYHKTPLHMAADFGASKSAEILITSDPSLQHLLLHDCVGRTAFHTASVLGHLEVVQLFMRTAIKDELLKTETSVYGAPGLVALQLAASRGHSAVVGYLLDYTSRSLPVDLTGTTVFHYAVRSGSIETIQVMLQKCRVEELLYSKTWSGLTAMHEASRLGHAEVVEVLGGIGANLDVQCDNGRTPLHFAAENDLTTVIKVLLELGADVAKRDAADRTPLMTAIEHQATQTIRILIEYDAANPLLSNLSFMSWAKSEPWWPCNSSDRNTVPACYQPKTACDVFHTFFCLEQTPLRSIGDLGRRVEIIQDILQKAEYWIASKTITADCHGFNELDGDPIYLRSKPLVGRSFRPVQRIVYTITSRDQGFWDGGVGGTHRDSYTRFDTARQREGSSTRPLQLMLNVTASKRYETQTTTWTPKGNLDRRPHDCSTDDSTIIEWVKTLKPGDRVLLVPKALYPGWTNNVHRAEMTVYTSCLPDAHSHPQLDMENELPPKNLTRSFQKRYRWSEYSGRSCFSTGFDHENPTIWT